MIICYNTQCTYLLFLVEVLSHMLKHPREIYAFTLAEVLITLGIIGIIAAMILPTLVNNSQKRSYVVALKKFYSTQNDGWARLLADEGVEQLDDTSVFQSINSIAQIEDANLPANVPFFNNLKKYFKCSVIQAPSNYQTYYLNGSTGTNYSYYNVLAFQDGSIVFGGRFYAKAQASAVTNAAISAQGGHMFSQQAYFFVDVNGFKKPNIYGRDIFQFVLSSDGKMYPFSGSDLSAYVGGNSFYWRNNSALCPSVSKIDSSSGFGYGCAARIMEEGWDMNY